MKKYSFLFAILLLGAMVRPHQANAQVTLNLKFFIQGYYVGNGLMRPVMKNELVPGATATQTDTVIIELHDTTPSQPIVGTFKGILNTDGTIACSYGNTINGKRYYIGVRHRNLVQTWSALPVLMSTTINYDFTIAATQAYNSNMVQVGTGVWAFYNGDLNQDQNIDLIDFSPLDFAIRNGLYGYYAYDINGDGNVDLFDFILIDSNISSGIFSQHP